MRISDWSSDVCSSDRRADLAAQFRFDRPELRWRRWGAQPQRVYRKIGIKKQPLGVCRAHSPRPCIDHRAVLNVDHGVRNVAERKCANRRAYSPSLGDQDDVTGLERSEEHTSELQSLMRISYAVFCLKK